jgi:hypothetical protein
MVCATAAARSSSVAQSRKRALMSVTPVDPRDLAVGGATLGAGDAPVTPPRSACDPAPCPVRSTALEHLLARCARNAGHAEVPAVNEVVAGSCERTARVSTRSVRRRGGGQGGNYREHKERGDYAELHPTTVPGMGPRNNNGVSIACVGCQGRSLPMPACHVRAMRDRPLY